MTKRSRGALVGLLFAGIGAGLCFSAPRGSASEDAEAQARDGSQPAAVEGDMHEFMEYVFEPPYKRLKAGLAASPAATDRNAWKGLKSDSLILAEAANLLLHRQPKERADAWDANAMAVRQQGGELYQAAKKKDLDLTKKHFAALLKKCNQCHDDFADGEHQLTP